MTKRKLGNSDLTITPVGIGSWAIGGGGWKFAWGSQDDNESIAAIRRGLEKGINWIDTAAIYGMGHSEEMVAKALEGIGTRPYIFTKCERRWNADGTIYPSLKAESIRKECEDSLRRLKVDAIDLYQIHWPEPEQEIEEGWAEMAKLQQEGKVRWIGVSNFNVEQIKRAQKIAPVTSLQPPYSLLRRGIEAEILPYVHSQNIGVIVYSPMLSGMLTGKMTRERAANFQQDDWRRNNAEFQEPKLSRNLELAELLRKIGQLHGRTPGEVAIAWTLNNPAVTAAIVGVRRPDQVDGVAGALEFRLSAEEIAAIERFQSAQTASA
ncbi:MAG TPA: aldo/keto reductase [Bryobacteraceae bacterium]|nr:aldo/keto reductase [Bryobacteraceae bacterium]